MRFFALLRKELRECLPWMILAAFVFLFFGGLSLSIQRISLGLMPYTFDTARWWSFGRPSVLSSTAGVLFVTSIVLAMVLGVRQFWVDHFTKTWGFTIHRSVKLITLLWAKLAAGAIAISLSLGIVWLIFYMYANQRQLFLVPPTTRAFIEGWFLIAVGLIFYLGTALSGLSEAKWYATKMVGLAFAIFILVNLTAQWKMALAVLALIAGAIVLLLQIIYVFLNREF